MRDDFIRLADVGIRGNGHMMMLEKNIGRLARVMDGGSATSIATARGRSGGGAIELARIDRRGLDPRSIVLAKAMDAPGMHGE